MMSATPGATEPAVEISRHRRLSRPWQLLLLISTTLCVVLGVYQVFNLGFWLGYTALESQYLYAIVTLLLPLVFVLWPAYRGAPDHRVPWYDALLFIITLLLGVYFIVNGEAILDEGWEYSAPDHAIYASYVFWILVLEGARRAGGLPILAIITVISLYPLYADKLPGPIAGLSATLPDTAIFHIMSSESVLGIPMRAFANLVLGFLLFGVTLQYTGGGRFFINIAFALLGHVRGGPAKVAIFASGLMGSMSGSVVTNVFTTGVMTIPAMRRTGFDRSYAAGVEACASTGGVLMPPIMGATAFVMATFLEVPYITIAIAAVIPSALYFLGLFVQIDAYAARFGLAGLPRAELPSVSKTLKEGWYFIAVFVLLIWMLVYLQREAIAPFYATLLLIVVNQVFPHHRWTWRQFLEFVAATGRLFIELAAVLAGVGLIVGALAVTGMSGTIANDLIFIAGGSTLVLLLMGAITSFILGIGMTVTAAYIFLAVALAPALIRGGLDPMAVHLFILYWGMLSYITPPVALGAYAAASVAQANPMTTGFKAMQLGTVIYFIPFFFVLNPALLLSGPWQGIVATTIFALAGIVLIAGALQGYLVGVGNLASHAVWGWPLRVMVLVGGLLLATPGGGLIPFSDVELLIAALSIMVPAVALALWLNRQGVLDHST
jgi:TRAP transporter 4TM/12TM fusion protein